MITTKGIKLAHQLDYYVEPSLELDEICSLLARHATTYARLQEMTCNGHPIQGSATAPIALVNRLQAQWDAEIERREPQVTRRLQELVNRLPPTADGRRITLDLQGDPRGCTVTLLVPHEKWTRRIGIA